MEAYLSQIGFQAVNGLVWGLIVALIALGLTLIFGLLHVINVAHGAFYMMGAIIAFYIERVTGNFWLSLLLAPFIVGGIGLCLERGVIRPVEGKPVITIIVTFGLLLIFQQLALATFGGAPQRLLPPIEGGFPLVGFRYPFYRIFVALFSLLILSGLWLFIYRTKYGMWMRAVQYDREMALGLGIPTNAVYFMTFGLGALVAGLGGALSAPIVVVSFKMGLDILVIAFIVVIVGGLGSIKGSVLAAILIGELEGISSVFVSPVIARVFSLVFMITVLMVRPEGLFGKER